MWHEAQDEYETAGSLAHIGLHAGNPIHKKIEKALQKVHMQVRNRVQLPPENIPNLRKVNSRTIDNESFTQTRCRKNSVFTKNAGNIASGPLSLRDIITKLNKD